MCQQSEYYKKQPCNDCPYRVDAPLRLWRVEEFRDLTDNDQDTFGKVYGCHKKDGHTCVGWLMDQGRRDFPSIALRLSLSRHNVTREYLDSLRSPSGLYESIRDMYKANYPELFSNGRK